MALDARTGPSISYGQNPPPVAGAPPADYNPDGGPNLAYGGVGAIDPRFGYAIGSVGGGSVAAFGFGPGVNYEVLNQVPTAAGAATIAAAANVVSGTPMTLVSSTGGGILVMTAALFIKPTGLTVPACLAIENLPAQVSFGQSGAIQLWDPTTMMARAVSITGVSGGTGGAFTVRGYDVYGQPMSETITATSGATTTNGKKAFKFVASVTPEFSDAHNYSVGQADIYGLPLKASTYGLVNSTFNNAPVTSPTFVAADTTAVSATTGDVRGTIVVTSDGTKRLQIMQGTSVGNLATLGAGVYTGMFGLTQFTN